MNYNGKVLKMKKSTMFALVSLYFMFLALLILSSAKIALVVAILTWIGMVILSIVSHMKERKLAQQETE